MDSVTLKQLRYFDALVRHRHFGRAAAASAISQPALSMQIRELETTLGSVLFERGTRHVLPTAAGEDVAKKVREILRSVEELSDLVRVSDDGLSGRLRLGIIPTIAPYLLPRLVETLSLRFPELDIHVRETVTPRLLQELSDGHLDTAVLALPISEPNLEEVALFDEAFVLVRPAGDESQPVPSGKALSEKRLLLLEEGHCFRDQALSFCNIRPAQPRSGLDGSSLSTLVQMVAAGLGVTLIPEMAVPVETRSANVAVSNFPDPQPNRTIGMVWRKTSPLAQSLQDIADVARNIDRP